MLDFPSSRSTPKERFSFRFGLEVFGKPGDVVAAVVAGVVVVEVLWLILPTPFYGNCN